MTAGTAWLCGGDNLITHTYQYYPVPRSIHYKTANWAGQAFGIESGCLSLPLPLPLHLLMDGWLWINAPRLWRPHPSYRTDRMSEQRAVFFFLSFLTQKHKCKSQRPPGRWIHTTLVEPPHSCAPSERGRAQNSKHCLWSIAGVLLADYRHIGFAFPFLLSGLTCSLGCSRLFGGTLFISFAPYRFGD